MLIDRRMMAGGAAMMITGGILFGYLGANIPAGVSGMSEEDILLLEIEERENRNYRTLAGILLGVGFLLVLISFGARRRRGGRQTTRQKPAADARV